METYPKSAGAYSHGAQASVDASSDLRKAALDAEWRIPDGVQGDVIRQLRHRANRASIRATRLLWALGFVVLSGLAFYLAAPIWQRWIDGQRTLLEQTIQNANQDVADLTPLAISMQETLHDILRKVTVEVWAPPEGSEGLGFIGAANIGSDHVTFYGHDSTLLSARLSTGAFVFRMVTELRLPQGETFINHADLSDGSVIIYGTNGLLVRQAPGSINPIVPDVVAPDDYRIGDLISHFVDQDGAIYLLGTGRTLLKSTNGGVSFTAVKMNDAIDPGVTFNQVVPVPWSPGAGETRRHLLIGSGGGLGEKEQPRLFELLDQGLVQVEAERLPKDASPTVYFREHVPVNDRLVLILGDEGTVIGFNPRTFGFLPIQVPLGMSDSVIFIGGFVPQAGNAIVYGDEGTLLQLTDDSSGLVTISGMLTDEQFPLVEGHVQIDDQRWMLFGGPTSLLIYDDLNRTITRPKLPEEISDSVFFSSAVTNGEGLWIIAGDEGTLVQSDDGAASFEQLQAASTSDIDFFTEFVAIGTETSVGPIFVRSDGGILVPDTSFANDLSEVVPASIGDPAEEIDDYLDRLLSFIDFQLPNEVRNLVAAQRQRLSLIQAEREFQFDLIDRTRASQSTLEEFPNSLLQEQERRDFEAFLATCLSPVTSNDQASIASSESLVACLNAWENQLRSDDEDWWDTLATQVPPGVLILFLLSTLGGLYRYNTRMAGFFHGRADTLTILASGMEEKAVEALDVVATALASDKVEFSGKAMPSDQAVDLAKVIAGKAPKISD